MKFVLFIIFTILISYPIIADELHTNTIVNDCGNTLSFSAVYEAISYDCGLGYFLPAGATACTPCPAGFTCSGGTFTFNSNITQGLDAGDVLITNAQNSCGNSFTQSFHAVFEPGTLITLNYDDGNGNTSQSQCEYNSTFYLPPTPNRVGYIFKGWKVKND